jgi:hypothetical protein
MPALRVSTPMPSSSRPTDSFSVASCELPPWRRATATYPTRDYVVAGGQLLALADEVIE